MARIRKPKSTVYDKWSAGYYNTGYKSKGTTYSNSSFWMDDDFLSDSDEEKGSKLDLVKLAQYKKAISNFVRIVTGKDDINVKYSSGSDSYTDGKDVVISAKLDEKEFDSTVGLALHEGSHIALTDFDLVKREFNAMAMSLNQPTRKVALLALDYKNRAQNLGVRYPDEYSIIKQICDRVKDLVNIIEDRRIDRFVYDSAPGYQGYYTALYNKYFNAKAIDEALIKGVKNQSTWDDYMFHICNFANPNRRLDTLPKLRQIWNMINLPNISRLKSTQEVFELAIEIYRILSLELDLKEGNKPQENKNGQQPKGSGAGKGSSGEDQESEDAESSGASGDGEDGDEEGDDNLDIPNAPVQMSPKEQRALEKAVKAQQEFLENKMKKSKLSKTDSRKINAIEESNMTYTEVGGGVYENTNGKVHSKTSCMVVKGMNDRLLGSGLMNEHYSDGWASRSTEEAVAEGIVLGTLLGRKLKTRDEERTLVTTRLETGKIDSRLIAELGFGNDRVFSQALHSVVTPALIHISIDASGSMSGTRWCKAIKTATAIAKAATMSQSLQCVISIRGTYTPSRSNQMPLMWVVYDSSKDPFTVVKDKFKYLSASSSTPEGLCYEAVLKEIINTSNGKDTYFINFSDGEPGFSSSGCDYHGQYAIQHTKVQIDKMRKAGISILSYFISESHYTSSMEKFKTMYGPAASAINTENLNELAKSINNLFERR